MRDPRSDPAQPPKPAPTITPDPKPRETHPARPEDAAAKPTDAVNPMLRTGTHAPDAADIEDPDHQL